MKTASLTMIMLLSSLLVSAQIKAITEAGDKVLLYDDNKWEYNNDSLDKKTIAPNYKSSIKDKNATLLVKSKKLNVGIWINPTSWTHRNGTDSEAYEFVFTKKKNDLYAVVISEKISYSLETLKRSAITNAKNFSTDFRLIKEEYRTVNGITVLMLNFSAKIQDTPFTYMGYYYSNSNGAFQLLTFTGEKLFDNYMLDMELFLNGLVEL